MPSGALQFLLVLPLRPSLMSLLLTSHGEIRATSRTMKKQPDFFWNAGRK